MPLVRISVRAGKPPAWIRAVGDSVHQAMVDSIGVPLDGKFQLFHEHADAAFTFDTGFRGVKRTSDLVVIQITLNQGRPVELKKALYARMAELLAKSPGVRKEDVLISLVEVPKENWSWGNGEATYAT